MYVEPLLSAPPKYMPLFVFLFFCLSATPLTLLRAYLRARPRLWGGCCCCCVVLFYVLQAPVPFLVGVHSRYLQETSSDRRPEGVVFVDLDNDKIYLGLDEDM